MKQTIFRTLGVLLLVLSIGLFSWEMFGGYEKIWLPYQNDKIKSQQEQVSASDIKENIEKTQNNKQPMLAGKVDEDGNVSGGNNNDGDSSNNQEISDFDEYGYEVDENGYPISSDPLINYNVGNLQYSQTPPSHLNTSYVVGLIHVPSVGITERIYEGLSNDNLWAGVGTVKPNQRMGERNYAIAGHHMENPNLMFSPLMNVQNGQKIYLTDMDKVYEYKIHNIVHVDPSQGQYMLDSQGNELVTLIVCTDPWGSQRRIVQGKLVKEVPMKQAPENIKKAFN